MIMSPKTIALVSNDSSTKTVSSSNLSQHILINDCKVIVIQGKPFATPGYVCSNTQLSIYKYQSKCQWVKHNIRAFRFIRKRNIKVKSYFYSCCLHFWEETCSVVAICLLFHMAQSCEGHMLLCVDRGSKSISKLLIRWHHISKGFHKKEFHIKLANEQIRDFQCS